MEKRKAKLNILDIAIFVAIICSIAALVFRDVIHDAFGTPEITQISITVTFDDSIEELEFNENETVTVVLDNGDGDEVVATVKSFEDGSLQLIGNGYKKFGRYYSESGGLVALGSDCDLLVGEIVYNCELQNVEANG